MSQLLKRIALLAALTLLAPSLHAARTCRSPEQAAPQGEDPPGADDDASDAADRRA